MNHKLIYKALLKEKVCLRCRHLFKETEDKSKRICECDNPVLAPAHLVVSNSLSDLTQQEPYKTMLQRGG